MLNGWSRNAANKFKMADGRHFEKEIEKSRYLRNHLTNFTEIWHGNASQRFAPRQPLKYQEFITPRKVQYLVSEKLCVRA